MANGEPVDGAGAGAGAVTDVRIGFIGCGGNAAGHMRRLGSVPGARIVAVCDVDAQRAADAASATGASALTDYRDLLDRPDLDAVYLSVPVFAHGAPELAVIARGLPMFVEKPVAIDLAMAHEISRAVTEAGLLTCVGYQLRYNGSTDLARERLAAPDAGPVGLVTGTYWCGTGRAQPNHWRTRMAQSGGQLVEQATHTVDMMRYLVGEVAEVFAVYGHRILAADPGDCPDSHAVALRFANGAVGTLSATWAGDPGDWSLANLVDIAHGERRLHWRTTGVTVAGADGTPGRPLTREDRSIDAVFVDAVRRRDGGAVRSDYADAVTTLAVTLAANESARTGLPVKIA
jgi:predicted dehydrogenase